MKIAIHWQDTDSSLANAVSEVFPDADIMISCLTCTHKMLKSHQKKIRAYKEMYGEAFPALW